MSFKSNFLALTLHGPDIRLFKPKVVPKTTGECFHSLHEQLSGFTVKCFIHFHVILMVYKGINTMKKNVTYFVYTIILTVFNLNVVNPSREINCTVMPSFPWFKYSQVRFR